VTNYVETVWVEVCSYGGLTPERGVRALVGGRHVAIFRTFDGAIYALDDVDPFSGASVLSRGIVGTRTGVPVVTSPMFKQAFDLTTGECLDEAGVSVQTYRVRVVDSIVLIGSP
jgi:nitrite reductase (NADH) small subunit